VKPSVAMTVTKDGDPIGHLPNSFAVKNGKRPIQGIPTNRNPNRFTNVEKASVVEHAPVRFVLAAALKLRTG
jgi:hypothetical protein